ncbi:MAG TPA: aminoglycoside adenylyltransferase domain-containing protein [Phototrophicaceae bacterium]|nr:aminoglycoside adenylyltransferase domain-containing protein [Phototrophicaceae bacterium]
MLPTIPEAIRPLLDSYLAAVDHELPGLLIGFYLHGSIALGAFKAASSDIDALAVVSGRCGTYELDRLTQIHAIINRDYPRPYLEVIYLQPSDLGRAAAQIEPFPYAHDGRFTASGHFEINDVTWWVLKNRGITLRGTPAADLNFTVDWDTLITHMRVNLNTYWRSYTTSPARIALLFSDYGIQWAVTGVLRQYYSFHEGSITSKDGAALYALDHVPQQWHRLIQEALNIRSGKRGSLYRSPLLRALDAYRFLSFIIAACNRRIPS